VADVVDTLAATGGNVLKLVHTHDGAAAAAMALAYGTPKDRKRLVKGMKGGTLQPAGGMGREAVVKLLTEEDICRGLLLSYSASSTWCLAMLCTQYV